MVGIDKWRKPNTERRADKLEADAGAKQKYE